MTDFYIQTAQHPYGTWDICGVKVPLDGISRRAAYRLILSLFREKGYPVPEFFNEGGALIGWINKPTWTLGA